MRKPNTDTSIISIEASSIKRAMDSEVGKVVSKEKMFKGVLPNSLEMIELKSVAPNEFKNLYGKDITTAIVNVQFNSGYYNYKKKATYINKKNKKGVNYVKKEKTKRGELLSTVEKLRVDLYTNGFNIDDVHYVEYKRSGSKAKQGNHLFIMEKYDEFLLYEHMINYARLGLKFPTDKTVPFDLTSGKSYESLTGSSIEYTLDIKPENILIVRDIKHSFKTKVELVKKDENGNLKVYHEDDYLMKNDIFDGESLLSSEYFEVDENGEQKGYQLLRNNFLKTASLNTNMDEHFKDVDKVQNAYGDWQDAKLIKLIITPNSLKIFKFKSLIPDAKTNKDCYTYWINHITSTFGVVKSEHISTYGDGNYNKLSSQMLSSLPLRLEKDADGKNDIDRILETDFQYIRDMKNYTSVFRKHIKNYSVCASGDFINNMLVNSNRFAGTDLYKTYRSDTIKSYKKNMKRGKVSILGDYATIFSMPWELLQSSLHQGNEDGIEFAEWVATINPIGASGEIYCSALNEDETVAMFRSPHICQNNVMVGKNKYHAEYETFNLTRGIVIVYPWENPIMERGNSLDYDSDSLLICRDKTIVARSIEVQCFATPVHDIKDSGDVLRYNTPESLAKLDMQISKNYIGEIVNLSMLLLSHYWNEYYKGEDADTIMMGEIQDQVVILAILSGIEIDKSKHVFDLDMKVILEKIKHMKFNGKDVFGEGEYILSNSFNQTELLPIYIQEQKISDMLDTFDKDDKDAVKDLANERAVLNEMRGVTKTVTRPRRPYFVQFAKNQQGQYVWDEDIMCPMNFIVLAIEAEPCKAFHNSDNTDLSEFLNTSNINIDKGIRTTSKKMDIICKKYIKDRKDMERDFKRDRDNDKKSYLDFEKVATEGISKLTINSNTMMEYVNKIYSEKVASTKMVNGVITNTMVRRYPDMYENRLKILSILSQSKWEVMKECFTLTSDCVTELYEDETGDITIWGIRYKEFTFDMRNDY